MKVYVKESMDRFGDDLTELILSYLTFEDKIKLECVSKQWKRCVFQRQFVIEINFLRRYETHNSLNGLFRRSDDERQSDEQRLVSVMKKCQNITKIILKRRTESEVIRKMRYFYPDIKVDNKVDNIEDLLNIDPNVLPLPQRPDFENELKYLLNSNRYAFDSEVLSLFGQYCPNINSLDITTTSSEDLKFFRFYGHKLEELILHDPIDENKDFLNFCPNVKIIYVMEPFLLFRKDKEFLPKLQNIKTKITLKSTNVYEMQILVDKYSQSLKKINASLIDLSAEELKTCFDCFSRFENLKELKLEFYRMKTNEPIDNYSPSIFVAFDHVVDISQELIQIGLLFYGIS